MATTRTLDDVRRLFQHGVEHHDSEALRLHRIADNEPSANERNRIRLQARDHQAQSETLKWALDQMKEVV